ncbi:hypothetical protein O6H91_16G008800 [Diphasiastrum complanatum]|nr:hypothetical protein O6H91_16G008800 [Diphasiastrum complanatum]KAJ7526491.1 hypothetical protein O6H91_16G008800 [Diphasiastrum complanatum]KAJ7526492.1 hypothetical protein O6H91_16G008800 [Diphasiastrum complanatum]KAJ7526493.1 hypothetical protein O6H91_16G008800 [Diphasiastrum complanatum]KAJ7526494.1 hypothetical protein O6H91_16G008800 [Diphasiastrum complanatum]
MMNKDELPQLGDDIVLKVRKPYTLKKQRERWTEEEHRKFVDALKLYGRAWRSIEEHIGTKTTVQIRSHAQKFFSKLEREQSGGATSTDMVLGIDKIPPPRPKRKPNHPYPRKAGGSCFSSLTDVERSDSPSSVPLSYAAVKFATPPSGEGYSLPAGIAPFSTPSKNGSEYEVSDTMAVTRPQPGKFPTSLKLFGQNVVVPTVHHSKDPAVALSLTRPPISETTSANSEETRFLPKQCGTEDEDETVVEENNSFSSLQDEAKPGLTEKTIPRRFLGDSYTGSIWKTVNSGVDMSCLDSSLLIKQAQESARELVNDGQDQSLTSSSALPGSHQMKSRLTFRSHEAADSIEKPSDWKVEGTRTNKLSSNVCMGNLEASSNNFPFTSTEYVRPEQPVALQGINSEVSYYCPGNLFGPWQWIPTLASYNLETLSAGVMPGVLPIAVRGLPPSGGEPHMSAAAAASAWWASQGIFILNTYNPSMGSSPAKKETGQQLVVQTLQAENGSKDIVLETQNKFLTPFEKFDSQASSKASLFMLTSLRESAEPNLVKSICNGFHSEDSCEQKMPGKLQRDVDLRKHYLREKDQKRARKGSTASCSIFISEDINSCLRTRDTGDNLRCLVRTDGANDCVRCNGNTSGDGGPSSNSSGCGNPSRTSNLNDAGYFDNAEDSECLAWRADGDIQSTSFEQQETVQTMEEQLPYPIGRTIRGTTMASCNFEKGERRNFVTEDGFTKHHGGAAAEEELQEAVSDEGRMVFPSPQYFSISSTSQEAGDSSNLCQHDHQLSDRSVPTNNYPFTNQAEGCIPRLTSRSCNLATSSHCRIAMDGHDRQEEVPSCSAFQNWNSSSLKTCEVGPSEQPKIFKGMMEPALSDSIDSSLELQEGKLQMLKAVRTTSSISKGEDSAFKGVGFVPYQ